MKRAGLLLPFLLCFNPAFADPGPDPDALGEELRRARGALVGAASGERQAAAEALDEALRRAQAQLAGEARILEGLLEQVADGQLDGSGPDGGDLQAALFAREQRRDLARLRFAEAALASAGAFADEGRQRRWREAARDAYAACAEEGAEPLCHLGLAGEGDALLAQGQPGAAAERYEALTYLEPPPGREEDPRVLALTRTLLIRAHAGWGRALLALGRPAEARARVEALAESAWATGWREAPQALLAISARAACLAAEGEPARAARGLTRFLDRDSGDPAGPWKLSARGLAVCRALAEVVTDGVGDPTAQLGAGRGHLLGGRPGPALARFKRAVGVLRPNGSQRDAAAAAAAAWEAWRLLSRARRHLEAALILHGVGGSRGASVGEVARARYRAWRRAAAQLGERPGDADAPLTRRAEEALREGGEGASDLLADAAVERAVGLERAGDLRAAAEAYALVPPTSRHRLLAMARRGRCLARLDDPRAADALREAASKAEGASVQAAWAVAALALGRLERQAGRRAEALSALEPFAGPLAGDPRATPALLERGLALGAGAAEAGSSSEARAAWAVAARPLAAWVEAALADTTASAELLAWVGEALTRGGEAAQAAAALEASLERGGLDPEAADGVRLSLARAWLEQGRAGEALPLLKVLRERVVLEGRGAPSRGRLLGRARRGPFVLRREGRSLSAHVWFTEVEVGGETRVFFDVAPERRGGWTTVAGEDPAKPHLPSDVVRLRRPFLGSYRLDDGLERATAARLEAGADHRFLIAEAVPANHRLVAALRRMSQADYEAALGERPLDPPTLDERRWQAELRFLDYKLRREDWSGVLSDLRLLALLGRRAKAPAWAQGELARIEGEALRRSGR
jgi:hypothetical protein